MNEKIKLEIIVPKDWSAVTLKDYLAFMRDVKAYEDEPEALIACLFHHLCHFPVEYLHKLDIDTYTAIKEELLQFISKVDYPLQRIIQIDGKKYGFEPDLSKIAYGAYVDISKYDSVGIDDKWANIMSILYRPLVRGNEKMYEIQPYNAQIDGDKFLNTTMDIHFGALFFFNNLLKDLLNSTLSSLMTEELLPPNIKSILEKSGNLIPQSFNSQMGILQNLKK